MFSGKPASFASPFGASTGNSLFSSQPKPGGLTFNSGATAGGGLFGATTTTAPSLFGNTAPAASAGGGLFGNTQSTGLFGATGGAQSKPLFGSTAATGTSSLFNPGTSTGGGLFGGAQTQPATTGVFGAGTAATGTSLFGSTMQQQQQSGTTIKFNGTVSQDTMLKNNISTNIQTKHQCISAMKEYENKSLEELRVEDYLANRKGPQPGATGGFSLGQPATATTATGGGLFGGGAAATGGGLFGNTANKSLFGNTSTAATAGGGLFSQATSTAAGGGLFGSTAAKPLFGGATTTTASTGFNFGAAAAPASTGGGLFSKPTQPVGAFGAPAAGGVFGQTSTAAPTFGSTANTGFTLGQPQAAGTFGKPGGLFGATATTAAGGFGAAGTGGLFSGVKPATTTTTPSLFGATAAPTAGTFGAGGGLFGNTAAKPGGLFGAPAASAAGGGLFGNTATAAPTFPSLAPKPGGLNFNNPAASTGVFAFTQPGAQAAPQVQTLGTDPATAAAQQAIFQSNLMGLAASPYGDSPLLKGLNLKKSSTTGLTSPTDPVAQNKAMQASLQRSSGMSVFSSNISMNPNSSFSRPSPRLLTSSGLNRSLNLHKSRNTSGIFDELDSDTSLLKDGFVPRKNVKKLIIRPKNKQPQSEVSHLPAPEFSRNRSPSPSELPEVNSITSTGIAKPLPQRRSYPESEVNTSRNASALNTSEYSHNPASPPLQRRIEMGGGDNHSMTIDMTSPERRSNHDESLQVVTPPTPRDRGDGPQTDSLDRSGVTLERADYYMIPSREELASMTDADGECWVEGGFTIGREGYGSVFWPDTLEVAGLNFDELVHFRHKEVIVYPNESEKPEVGQELNRPAEVTLERVWPVDKTTREDIKDPERLREMKFRERLERASRSMGADFVDYLPETGSWVFKVPHFSKYGLVDDDDEEEVVAVPAPPSKHMKTLHLVQKSSVPKSPEKANQKDATFTKRSLPLVPRRMGIGLGGGLDVDMEEEILEADDYPTNYLDDEEMEETNVVSLAPSFMKSPESRLMRENFFIDKSSKDITHSSTLQNKEANASSLKDLFKKSESILMDLSNQSLRERVKLTVSRPAARPAPETFLLPINSVQPVALEDSIILDGERNLCDAGLFHGRRLRTGFSRDLRRTGLWLMRPDSGSFTDSSPQQSFGIKITPVLKSAADTGPLRKGVEAMLSLAEIVSDGGMCSRAVAADSYDIINAFNSMFPNVGVNTDSDRRKRRMDDWEGDGSRDSRKYECETWKLISVLWGDLELADLSPYQMETLRRVRLERWLFHQFAHKPQAYDPIEQVLELLKCGDVEGAAEKALMSGDLHLAFLISTAGTCGQARDDCLDQLSQWKVTGADRFIDDTRVHIYALLAGKVQWTTSDNRHLNLFRQLDWLNAFALRIWYCVDKSASIPDVVGEFDASWNSGRRKEFCPPLSPRGDELDLQYQLLKLYCDSTYPIKELLSPSTHFISDLDYHLSWELMCCLKAIGYTQMEEIVEERVNVRFAEQLGREGLWTQGVFVLMHISNPESRSIAIRNLLGKYGGNTSEEEISFLTDKLSIPREWIFEAKCLCARYKNDKWEEGCFALEAKSWNLAHKIFVDHLGPLCIIRGNYRELGRFVGALSANSDLIENWDVGGAVFHRFLEFTGQIQELAAAAEGPARNGIETLLKDQVAPLVAQLSSLTCKTPTQKLSRAEMSKRICDTLRAFLSERELLTIAQYLVRFPLPDDYKLEVLSDIISCSASVGASQM